MMNFLWLFRNLYVIFWKSYVSISSSRCICKWTWRHQDVKPSWKWHPTWSVSHWFQPKLSASCNFMTAPLTSLVVWHRRLSQIVMVNQAVAYYYPKYSGFSSSSHLWRVPWTSFSAETVQFSSQFWSLFEMIHISCVI